MNLNLQRAEIHPDSWDSRAMSRRRRRARIGGTIVEVSRVVPMWCRDDPRSFENAKMAENDARERRVRSRSRRGATFFFWCEGLTGRRRPERHPHEPSGDEFERADARACRWQHGGTCTSSIDRSCGASLAHVGTQCERQAGCRGRGGGERMLIRARLRQRQRQPDQ